MGVKELENKYEASYSTIQRVCKKYNFASIRAPKNGFAIMYKKIRELEKDFIEDWTSGILTADELVEKYECPYTNIYSRSVELNISRNSLCDNIDRASFLIDWNNHKLSPSEINNKYNISDGTRRKILGIMRVKDSHSRGNRKYFFNEKYFDEINSEEKAYFLGLIYADGSHYPDKNSLRLCLQQEDEHILKKFYECIECDREIHYIYNKVYNRYYPYAYVQHPYLSNRLSEIGVMADKSFKIRFPSKELIPNDLIHHFIRGYCDGDGSVSFYEKFPSKLSVSMTSNYEFIKQLECVLLANTDIKNFTLYKVKTSDVYILSKGGRFQAQELLNYLYKDATIYLHRKYNKFQQITNYNKENVSSRNKFINQIA